MVTSNRIAARARRGRGLDVALARQIGAKRTPRRLAPRRRAAHGLRAVRLDRLLGCDLGGRRRLGRVLHQLAELQLQLIEQVRALGGWPEPLVLQLGDRELQGLDLRVEVALALLRFRRALMRIIEALEAGR